MISNNVFQTISFAYKARLVTLGMDNVLKNIKQKKSFLIIFANDGGDSQRKKVSDKSKSNRIDISFNLNKEDFEKIFPNKNVSVISINEVNFAKKIKKIL